MAQADRFELRLFVGTRTAIRNLAAPTGARHAHAMDGATSLIAWPFEDHHQDALHRVFGTGHWLPGGIRLSSRDLDQCAKASLGQKLCYIEAVSHLDVFQQASAAWGDGKLLVRPTSLKFVVGEEHVGRPRRLWPINVALAAIGITPTVADDAMHVSGLAKFATNADLSAHAPRIQL